jgi:hypothetical protein
MDSTTISFQPVDGDAIHVVFSPALTLQMSAELSEVLEEPATREEIIAVVQGLTEDWGLHNSRLPSSRTLLN